VNGDRYFLDAFFAVALFNRRDRDHASAQAWLARVRTAREVWTTEAVLLEIGDGLSVADRRGAVAFIGWLKQARNVRVVAVDTGLFERGLALYAAREDKTWGLTDCISFVVMQEQKITGALTGDEHFEQAGFKALMK